MRFDIVTKSFLVGALVGALGYRGLVVGSNEHYQNTVENVVAHQAVRKESEEGRPKKRYITADLEAPSVSVPEPSDSDAQSQHNASTVPHTLKKGHFGEFELPDSEFSVSPLAAGSYGEFISPE